MHPPTELNNFIDDALTGARTWFDREVDEDEWVRHLDRGEYASLFAGAPTGWAVGHKGADLLFWTPAHRRMAQFVPSAKPVVTLRNPVNRAWSHCWDERSKGREALAFEDAIRDGVERSGKSAHARHHLTYLERGFCSRSLEQRWSRLPRPQVYIVILEEDRQSAERTPSNPFSFVGIDTQPPTPIAAEPRNRSAATVPRRWTGTSAGARLDRVVQRAADVIAARVTRDGERSRALSWPVRRDVTMESEARTRLAGVYTDEVHRLSSLIEIDLNMWKATRRP
jgi:hypothetical protein